MRVVESRIRLENTPRQINIKIIIVPPPGGRKIIGKNIRKNVGVFEYTRWLFFFAALTLLVISFFAEISVFSFSKEEFSWFLFLALVPTMIGHNIFYYLIKSLAATTVAAVPLGEPVVSSLGALIFFGEPVSLAVVIGGGITLIGGFLVVRFGR